MGIPVMVTLDAAAGGLFSVLSTASAAMLNLGRSGESMAAGLSRIGPVAAAGVAAGLGVIIDKSVEAASTFESEMEHLVTSAGLPKAAMNDLGQSFLTMAGQVGTSADDLAKSAYFVLSQLKTNAADTATVIHASAELAKVDGTDTVTATQAMATAMHDYNIPVSESIATANQFRAAVADSNTTIGDFAGNLGKVFQAAQSAHIGLSDVLGAVATLTSEGMPAANASNLLASTIEHLSAETPAGAKALDMLGISVTDFEKTIDSPNGLVKGLGMVQDGLAKAVGPDGLIALKNAAKDTASSGVDTLTAAIDKLPTGAQTTIKTLADMSGGVRGLAVVLGLTGDNFATFTKNVNDVANGAKEAGSDVEGFAQIQQTTAQQVDQLKASAHSLAIELGTVFLPAVNFVVKALATFFEFLASHKAVATALAIVIGTVLVGALVLLTAATWAWAAALWATGIPEIILLIMAVVAVFAILAYEIYKNRAVLVQWAQDIWQAINHAWQNIAHAFDNFVHALGNIWHACENVGHAFENVGHAIGNVMHAFDNVAHAISNVVNFFTSGGASIQRIMADIVNFVTSGWSHVVSAVENAGHAVLNAVVSAWNTVTSAVGTAVSTVVNWVSNAWNTVVSVTEAVWNTIVSVIEGIWNRIVSTAQTAASNVVNAIRNGFGNALSAVLGFVGSFASAGFNLMMGLVHGIESAVGSVVHAVTSAVSSAYHAVLGFLGIHSPSTLFRDEVGLQIMAGMAVGISDNAHMPSSALLSATGNLSASIPGIGTLGANFSASAVQSAGRTNVTIQIEGPVIGSNMTQAANDIWQELLKAKNRGVRLGLA